MDSLQLPGRRGPGDGRWTDDGQPQAVAQAAAIAQAVEEQFISQLRSIAPANSPAERQSQNSGVQEKQPDALQSNDSPVAAEGANTHSQQSEGQHQENGDETTHQEVNTMVDSVTCGEQVTPESILEHPGECLQAHEPMTIQPFSLNTTPNGNDSMEIGEGNDTADELVGTMPGFVNSSSDFQADLQCDGGSEAHASLHDVPVQATGSGGSSGTDDQASNLGLAISGLQTPNLDDFHAASVRASVDVDMNSTDAEGNQSEQPVPASEYGTDEPSSRQNTLVTLDTDQAEQTSMNNEVSGANAIDPTFLEALPEDLRAEVLASQQAQSVQAPTYAPPSAEDIDPEFLAALPPDIQAEVLAQQRAQRVAQQAEGQPVDMDNASIIATFPADLREEVCVFNFPFHTSIELR